MQSFAITLNSKCTCDHAIEDMLLLGFKGKFGCFSRTMSITKCLFSVCAMHFIYVAYKLAFLSFRAAMLANSKIGSEKKQKKEQGAMASPSFTALNERCKTLQVRNLV